MYLHLDRSLGDSHVLLTHLIRYGTGCFLLMNTGEKPSFSDNGLLSTVQALSIQVLIASHSPVPLRSAISWEQMHPPSTHLKASIWPAPTIFCDLMTGSVAIAGVGVSWLRDNMKFLEHAEESEVILLCRPWVAGPDIAGHQKVARSVPDTGGVYFVPAFSGKSVTMSSYFLCFQV